MLLLADEGLLILLTCDFAGYKGGDYKQIKRTLLSIEETTNMRANCSGRIDKEKTNQLFDAFLKDIEISGVYICGPESMIIGVKESLIEKGTDSSKVHFELFTAPSIENQKIELALDSRKIESNVAVIIDGEQIDLNLDSTGENVLDAAQKAGGDLPFACKGGVCCTCKAKILEGSAIMDVNYALEKDEVEAGYILTCQAHPTSDKLIVSFDE